MIDGKVLLRLLSNLHERSAKIVGGRH